MAKQSLVLGAVWLLLPAMASADVTIQVHAFTEVVDRGRNLTDGGGGQASDRLDREGFVLYTFENDRNDTEGDGAADSDCDGGCAVTWLPLYAGASDEAQGDFTIIGREDGSRQ